MPRPPTIEDVAEALGMHKSTVSKALSGTGTISPATRARVQTFAREMGYEPNPLAQRLAYGGASAVIGIITGSLDVGIGTQKILLIQKALAARSLEAPLYTFPAPTGRDGQLQAAQVQRVCRQRPQAIVCAGQSIHPAALGVLEEYRRDGGILVSYDMPLPLECDQVIFDREDNAYQAARCLLERGHRQLGIGMSRLPAWASEENRGNLVPQTPRIRGFCRALAEFRAEFHPEWLFLNSPYEQGGEEMAQRFLNLDSRPTGITIINDYVALAFMDDVMRAGVDVPRELSIISHDNQPIASHSRVPLTAISHPVEEIAEGVVQMLMERIEGYQGAPRTLEFRGELVERESAVAHGDPVVG